MSAERGRGDAGKTNERTAKGVEEGNDARSLGEQPREREGERRVLPLSRRSFYAEVCEPAASWIICYLPRESSPTQIGLFLAALNASQ